MTYATLTLKMTPHVPGGTIGHMWVVLTGPDGVPQSYGFQPTTAGGGAFTATPGYVDTSDDEHYTAAHEVTFPLDKAQFEAALDFCTTCVRQEAYSEYNVFTHSCVDFAWDVVKQAGITVGASLWQQYFQSEGGLRPEWNESLMDATLAAYLSSGNAYSISSRDDFNEVWLNGVSGSSAIRGGASTDGLTGGSGDDSIWGFAGQDVLDGDEGNDVLYGGKGDDVLLGGAGSNIYVFEAGDGNDTILTDSGADTLRTSGGYTYFERDGVDLVVRVGPVDTSAESIRVPDWFTPGSTSHQLWSVVANGVAYNQFAINDRVLRVEGSDDTAVGDNITGVAGYSDVVFGNGGDDVIDVSTGDDSFKASDEVHGGDGNDEIAAGNSNDFLYGDAGDDVIDAGTGADLVEGGDGDDAIYSWGGPAELKGGAGADFVYSLGEGASLIGDDGDDYLYDRGVNNVLNGGNGDDFLRLRGTNAYSLGGAGDDLFFNDGLNTLMVGGAGSDTYFDRAGGATIALGSNDGSDFVVQASESTTVQFTTNAALSAHRSGGDLVVGYGSGSSMTFEGWFTGQSRATLEMPDGSRWSPAQVDSNFQDAVYSITYSTGVLSAATAATTLQTFLPDLTGYLNPNGGGWEGYAQTPYMSSAVGSSTQGTVSIGEGGTAIWKGGITGEYTMVSSPTMLQSGHAGDYYTKCTLIVEWDYWYDASGEAKLAVTNAGWSVQSGERYMDRYYSWEDDSYHDYLAVVPSQVWSGGATSSRQVTLLQPSVDSFTLYSPSTANSMALSAMVAEGMTAPVPEDSAWATTQVVDVPQFEAWASVEALEQSAPSFLRDTSSLAAWNTAAARLGEDLAMPELSTTPVDGLGASTSIDELRTLIRPATVAVSEFQLMPIA